MPIGTDVGVSIAKYTTSLTDVCSYLEASSAHLIDTFEGFMVSDEQN